MDKITLKTIIENEKEKVNYVNLTHEFKTMCTCSRAYKIREGIFSTSYTEELADEIVGDWLFNKFASFSCEERTETLELNEELEIIIVYETIVGISSRDINAYWYIVNK